MVRIFGRLEARDAGLLEVKNFQNIQGGLVNFQDSGGGWRIFRIQGGGLGFAGTKIFQGGLGLFR